jgi:hypothetical protein
MAPAVARPIPWGPVVAAVIGTAALAGLLAWRWDLQRLESRIAEKRAALKKLSVSGGIPPNQEVADYLNGRQAAIEQRYQQWHQLVAAPPIPESAKADPQLYFQEHFHQVQRALEQLAAARTLPPPELLGFPKELPPSDTVPRLLVQLELIQEAGELIFGQPVTALASFKVEDPESVTEEQGTQPFLIRLPVRVRMTASLPQAMKALAALHRADPLIDIRSFRSSPGTMPVPVPVGDGLRKDRDAPPIISAPASDQLDVELVMARYLILPPTEEPEGGATPAKGGASKKPARAKPAPRKQP